MRKGWVIGDEEFLRELQQRFRAEVVSERALDPAGRRAWREGLWSEALAVHLAKLPAKEKTDQRASAIWKAVVAAQMKATTDASNARLASKLDLSSPTYASKQAGLARWKAGHRRGFAATQVEK